MGNYKPWGHNNSVTIQGVTRSLTPVQMENLYVLYFNHAGLAATKSALRTSSDTAFQVDGGKTFALLGVILNYDPTAVAGTYTISDSDTVDNQGDIKHVIVDEAPAAGNLIPFIREYAFASPIIFSGNKFVGLNPSATGQVHRITLIGYEID